MEDDFSDWLNKRVKEEGNEHEIVKHITESTKPLLLFLNKVNHLDTNALRHVLVTITSGLIVSYTDTFDDAYSIVNDIKDIIVKKEGEYNKEI